MAVNQAQVDHIISTASADDPEVKLLKLQDEVDLIKISIKKLLIDIRERLNELENPFAGTSQGSVASHQVKDADMREEAAAAREAAAAAREAAAAAREAHVEAAPAAPAASAGGIVPGAPQPPLAHPGMPGTEALRTDPHMPARDQLLEELRAQLAVQKPVQPPRDMQAEKVRLQKVYHLFGWTAKTVRTYGHDRLEMMLESYRAMGYITKESCEQVKEISRLMPASIGEVHELSADVFVSELYALNRILDPADTTLDRDMIEVLMEQKRRLAGTSSNAELSDKKLESSWAELPDRA
jgi:hypothetical protein